MKEKVGIIIEARMGSTRLASKTLKLLHGKPMLEMLVERLKRVNYLYYSIILLTSLITYLFGYGYILALVINIFSYSLFFWAYYK